MMPADHVPVHEESAAKIPADATQNSNVYEVQTDSEKGYRKPLPPVMLKRVYPHGTVSAILTDIEGTTTAISFVHEVLFPYAKKNVRQYLMAHQNDPAVHQIIQEVKEAAGTAQADLEQVAATLLSWMEQDKKITPLKTLQGMMWEDGYRQGAFQGHLYEDACLQLKKWKGQGIPLYVYSSGSVQAQKLLFSHSNYGDLSVYFSNYFDTKTGGKKEKASYVSIAEQIKVAPQSVLFLSDTIEELNAAHAAGMQTLLLCRDGAVPANCPYAHVINFNQIEVE